MKIVKDEDKHIHRMCREIESVTICDFRVKIRLISLEGDVIIEELNELSPGTWKGVTIQAEMLDTVIEFLQKAKKDMEGKE